MLDAMSDHRGIDMFSTFLHQCTARPRSKSTDRRGLRRIEVTELCDVTARFNEQVAQIGVMCDSGGRDQREVCHDRVLIFSEEPSRNVNEPLLLATDEALTH